MAGKVLNIKVFGPLKRRSGLTGNYPASATTHTIFRYGQCNQTKLQNE